MRSRSISSLFIAGALMLGVGCAQQEAAEDEGGMQEAALPDTVGTALWSYLQQENYQQNWALWPDKGRLYSGGEPHGMLLTSYLNETALEALENGTNPMPTGAIVVKENYMPDSTLAAVTVMYKTENFNAEHNNWFFLKRNADGSYDAAGRFEGCQNCHGARADNDYILTADLGAGGGME